MQTFSEASNDFYFLNGGGEMGALIGVYTLWVMFQDEVKYQFNG